MVAFLIRLGADVEEGSDPRETPLLHAMKFCKYKVLPALIKAGANVNFVDSTGMTALHYAIKKPHPMPQFELLLQAAELTLTSRTMRAVQSDRLPKRNATKAGLALSKGSAPANLEHRT